MRRSYLEAAFRHWLLVLIPVVMASALGVGFALTRPSVYVSTASIWADKPISSPDASTIGTTGGDAPPSAGQQALMANYLATRTFLLTVAAASPLPPIDPNGPAVEVEPALARLAGSVSTTTPGPNVLSISVRQHTPALATGVAKAVVAQFLGRERAALELRAGAQVRYAQVGLDDSAKALKESQKALAQYRKIRGPVVGGQVDAQEEELQGDVGQAKADYFSARTVLDEAQAHMAFVVDESMLSIADEPAPAAPLGRKRIAALAGAAGLLAGLSIAVGALVLVVSRDTSPREEGDIEDALGLRVVGTVERFDQQGDGWARIHRPDKGSASARTP